MAIFIFYICQEKKIIDQINDIIYFIKNFHLISNYEKGYKKLENKLELFNKDNIEIINQKQKIRNSKKELIK